jgi:hypothetical protein
MNTFTGQELLRFWQAGKENGLSQRRAARLLGIPFNSLHGKIFREQRQSLLPKEQPLTRDPDSVLIKSAIFDIETTSLKAGGVLEHMVCMCILPLDSDNIKTFKIEFNDLRNDRRVLSEAAEALSEYSFLIGHNITGFDLPWMNSRLVYHNLPQLRGKFMIYDTYQASRRSTVKAERKSMAFLCDFFRLKYVKTAVLPVSWSMIDSPNRNEFDTAQTDIVYHCEEDCKANRQLFNVLWPYDRSQMNVPIYRK